MFRQEGFTIFLNFGTESMSNDESSIKIQFTDVFKHQVRDLAKRYRKIKLDIQPIFEKLKNGELIGEQIQKTSYTVFKVRVKNSDIQKGKSGGYRVIYYVNSSTNILCILIYSKSEKDNVTATEIKKVIQEDFKVELIEYPSTYPADEPNRRCPDITRISETLDFQPKVNLEEGLARFFKWTKLNYTSEILAK